MHVITTPSMPKANGHYSQCIAHHGILYLSGQLPIDPISKNIPATIEEQTDLTLQKIEVILKEAGSSKNNILQTRVYIADVALWAQVNDRYALFFGDHKPARCIVPVPTLHYGCLIEIEATAVLPDSVGLQSRS